MHLWYFKRTKSNEIVVSRIERNRTKSNENGVFCIAVLLQVSMWFDSIFKLLSLFYSYRRPSSLDPLQHASTCVDGFLAGAEHMNVSGHKKITSKMAKRTDKEGKHKTPYRELRLPHLDGNDSKHEHGHCKYYYHPFPLCNRNLGHKQNMVRYHQSGTSLYTDMSRAWITGCSESERRA